MSAYSELAEIAPHQIWAGVVARLVPGERVSFAVVELEPDTVVPEHAHENEQLGVLASGQLRFRIGGEERTIGAGGTWSIPPNVPHDVVAGPEGAVAIEVFAPARADWSALERGAASPPSWPVPSGRL
ncbi:MAG TPA: cupin domain-containing protein [Gaiellaceae bacterium]|nr:cupin domain-containing protein [Gaiellaceae bacterium]